MSKKPKPRHCTRFLRMGEAATRKWLKTAEHHLRRQQEHVNTDYRVASGERPPARESGPRKNTHPTVKPTALMRYLCRLVTPPGGIELDPDYARIAEARIRAIQPGLALDGAELPFTSKAIAP